MRRFFLIFGFILCLAVPAGAQGPAGAGGGSGTETGGNSRHRSSPRGGSSKDFTPWQFSVGYQYNRINLTGSPFSTNGLSTDVTRYFTRWFGVEGQLGFGFGNTGATTSPANLSMKSLFAGGGARLAYRGHGRFEPWVHGVVGTQHFRFTQTAGVLGSNSALAVAFGGGADYQLGPRMALRVEADAIQSRFFSTNQRHFQVFSGLVFNF